MKSEFSYTIWRSPSHGISAINKLVEELTTQVLSAHDAEVCFRTLALRGNPKKALALLDRLDNNQK